MLQNLRSVLDHVAYQIVLDARGGVEPDWRVYYPISASSANYQAARKGLIKGVNQEIIDAIDTTEPYKGGKGHVLWQLNELNNFDKHRLLVGAASYAAGVDISPTLKQTMKNAPNWAQAIPIPSLFIREAGPLRPLHVGYELYIEPMDHVVDRIENYSST